MDAGQWCAYGADDAPAAAIVRKYYDGSLHFFGGEEWVCWELQNFT